MSNKRWVQRPEGSNWGDFGENDFLGRLNLITPEKVKQAVAEVVDGITLCLSLPLDLPGGTGLNANRLPPIVRPNLRHGKVNMNYRAILADADVTDVLSDDLVILHTQYSTQWDAFAHVGSEFDVEGNGELVPVYYNGFRAGVEVLGPADLAGAGLDSISSESTSNAGVLGVDSLATSGIQSRGVLIDIAHHFGTERMLFGYDELQEILQKDEIVVEPGDILVLHTGFAEKLVESKGNPDPETLHNYAAVLDGRDQKLLQWITDSGIAAIAADNYAVELYPATETEGAHSTLPLHEHCLFKQGIPLGELWDLAELSLLLRERKRNYFLLTAPPLRLPGATGSPVTPVATI
ncbi:cyclase family protein [Corynebacterium sp. S7]